jgi:hypothetical protein
VPDVHMPAAGEETHFDGFIEKLRPGINIDKWLNHQYHT